LTYENPDFGIKMQYPSNWIKQQDNLVFSTIVAFQLIHQNIPHWEDYQQSKL